MNFKRFHESKNLFPLDANKLHVGRIESDGTIAYEVGTITIGTDSVTYQADVAWRGFYTDYIQVSGSEKLTMTLNTSSTISQACNCYDTNDNFLGKATSTSTSTTRIFTLLQGTVKIRVNIVSSDLSYTITNPMLNTESSALPYEPYSSEVWHDIPYYIHNTSTDTITTPPTVIYPTGTTTTVGLKGNTLQSSVPSPTSPIMPQGTGERTGNVLDYTTVENTSTATATQISGGISVSGRYYVQFKTVKFTVGSSYTMSWTAKTVSGTVTTMWRFRYSDNTYSSMPSSGGSLVAEKEVTALLLYVNTSSTASGVAELTNIMLNTGSTALPYEPYGYEIPISSANTTTPIYLGEVETTRKIRKLVLTGEENITSGHLNVNLFNIPIDDYIREPILSLICTHYKAQLNVDEWTKVSNKNTCFYVGSTVNFRQLYIRDSSYSTIAGFKSYLAAQYAAGTPVTIWYVLANEETAVVNEPLMKIGNYADEVSGITIPVTAGANTISVDTTLQPSEVTVNYKGWHNAECKEYSYNMTIADWESASISQMENHTIQELQGGNWV